MAVELASHVRLSVCVDAVAQVAALGEEAARAGVHIDVLVEVDAGQHRCGVASDDALLSLADAIAAQRALRFGYSGVPRRRPARCRLARPQDRSESGG